MSSQTTHLTNVSMRQSNGPKATMPESRPLGELLLALDKFNEYELYTGTGNGVQPLIADGVGTSNVSFKLEQNNAQALNGKFVYFDKTDSTWKAAYASIETASSTSYTAQGFAIALSSTGLQITTSGKLIVPVRLQDYSGVPVVAGSYYYLCQDRANAGLIQQNAPASGIKQIVCQVSEVTENSTTLVLLNDLNQIANDIIMTDGDGSKYLGDDGQYHNMMVAGLAGRTSNCIDTYEILDIDFQNIGAGAESYGYIEAGNITVDDNYIASNFSASNYLISKYLIENYTQYSFRTKQSFKQVQNTDPLLCSPNKHNYIAIENGKLKLVLNDLAYFGRLTYEPNIYYYFKLTYNYESGYVLSSSTDGQAWTNEIILYDDINYFNNTTVFLGIIIDLAEGHKYASGSIDLKECGIDYVDNEESKTTYPLSSLTNKNVAAITVTFKGTGLIAAGRSAVNNTVNATAKNIDVEKAITIASDATDLVWDSDIGLTTTNYSEVDYKANFEGDTTNSTYYAKDTNLCYKQTIIYPNFLEAGAKITKDTSDYTANVKVSDASVKLEGTVLSGFSGRQYATLVDANGNPVQMLPGTQPWEIKIKCTTGTLGADRNYIYGQGTSKDHTSPLLFISTDKKLSIWLGSDGTSWNIASSVSGTIALADNTTYYIKYYYDGTAYKVDASTDDKTYTNHISVASTKIIYQGLSASPAAFGNNLYDASITGEVWTGSIDLSECYIKYGDTIVWQGITRNTQKDKTIVDLSSQSSTFHPNTFLNRNGFNFNLKLDLTGNLKVERPWDIRNYNDVNPLNTNTYDQTQGVDWNTFVEDGNYVHGVKISSKLGTSNTGTSDRSLYAITTKNDSTFADVPYGQDNSAPAFFYFNFIKPVRFSKCTFLNYKDTNYIPTYYTLHVSNDLNKWHSIIDPSSTGYVENGMFGNLPMDAYTEYTNKTASAFYCINCIMPDDSTYWKYVRLGVKRTSYRPGVAGFWIGSEYHTGADTFLSTLGQTMTELIFEKKDFINTGTAGINASVERKKIGTAYQVKFIDRLAYTNIAPENAVIDSTGKKLVPNNQFVYKDARCQQQYKLQRLAYQTRLPRYLQNNIANCMPWAMNPYNNDEFLYYCGSANTGTVANSYYLLQKDQTTGYDFANGLNESAYVITFKNKSFVSSFAVRLAAATAKSPNLIKIYGAVNGGSEAGTVSQGNAGTKTYDAAVWEEVPITKVVNVHGTDETQDLYYQPTDTANTTQTVLSPSNQASGTATTGDWGQYQIYIKPKRAYQQYKVTIQRTINNSVVLWYILPCGVYVDPWATPIGDDGTNLPILPECPYYMSSTLTTLPDKDNYYNAIYASPMGTATVWNLYAITGDSKSWDSAYNREFAYLQMFTKYPLHVNSFTLDQNTDLAYSANLFELYGTTNENYGKTALSNDNSLWNWSRATSLIENADTPTILSTTVKYQVLQLGKKEYGYNYHTALFARNINNKVLLDRLMLSAVYHCDTHDDKSAWDEASYYTEEWKWTNVAGNKGDSRTGACYNHPLLHTGDTSTTTPMYEVKRKGEFDRSKFTVVGSPTITDDGIATISNFNYLQVQNPIKVGISTFEFQFEIRTMDSTGTFQECYVTWNDPNNQWATRGITFNYGTISGVNAEYNTEYKVKCSYKEGYLTTTLIDKITGEIRQNTREFNTEELTLLTSTTYLAIGVMYQHPDANTLNNPIDLNAFKIYVDGKEVFSGQKDHICYTSVAGEKDAYAPSGTQVYRTTEPIEVGQLTPYESRWMYKFTDDSDGSSWYSNTSPSDTKATNGSYMYRNIIPTYNKEYATGIPLTATANIGSANGFTYFASSFAGNCPAWQAFQNLSYDAECWASNLDTFNKTTGLPTGDPQYLGFISPKPITVQGYSISARATAAYLDIPAIWDFQGSNDGETWDTLDSRNTKLSGDEAGTDIPVSAGTGSTYYFNNEKAYTQYRWLVKKIQPGAPETVVRIKVWNLAVLEENPVQVQTIYELKYTDATGKENTAYTATAGSQGTFVGKDATIYQDPNLQNKTVNVWTYEVTDGEHTYWTKEAGNQGSYVQEGAKIFIDKDCSEEYTQALVDTWTYTGTINKGYAYTGKQTNNFTWDGQEPYNKCIYTGNKVNEFIYTGKIEGWQYTGVSEDIYELKPSIKLALNRDDSRQIAKKTYAGNAYPVASADSISTTTYYSFTTNDTPGTIVPTGTLLYLTADSTDPAATADGTNTYVYGSAPEQSRYTYEYAWARDDGSSDGQPVKAGTKIYSDPDLTNELADEPTTYTWSSSRVTSELTTFYHEIEETPTGVDQNITDRFIASNYNVGLNFNGNKYTFTSYQDGKTIDTQEFESTDKVKSSYEDKSTILMRSQDIAQLNLSDSTYSWWEWNGLTGTSLQEQPASIFRLAKIDGSASQIDHVYKLYPWKVGDGSGGASNVYAYNYDKQKYTTVKSATIVKANDPAAALPKGTTEVKQYINIIDAASSLSTAVRIDNIYLTSDINSFLNNADIPNNTLILGYGGYL